MGWRLWHVIGPAGSPARACSPQGPVATVCHVHFFFINCEGGLHMGELIDKAKGKAKQVEGSVTGDRQRQAEGIVEEKRGDAKGKFEEVKQGIKDAFKK
jgi:uncharacterized protein YjbJ (UPF0337 family)